MFSSLRTRLWLTYVVIVGAVISLVGVALIVYLIRNPSESRLELQRLRLITTIIIQRGEALNIDFTGLPPERLQTAVDRAAETFGARVIIIDANGRPVADSQVDNNEQTFPMPGPNSRRASVLPYLRDNQGRIWLFAARPLQGGGTLYVLALRPQVRILSVFRDEFFAPFGRAAAIALLLSLLLALWVANWISAPLKRMAGTAKTVSTTAAIAGVSPIPLNGPSEVKTLGRAFNEMLARLQASQQSQRDFVANVSHDLKTPLTSIQGFAQAILDGTVDSAEALKQAAQVIYDEAGRMHRLVLDLLDLARLDSGIADLDKAALDLSAMLGNLVEKFTPLARQAGVEIQAEISGLLNVTGDADRLAQVFTNLVDNALKFTPVGGTVQLKAAQVDGYVEVSVADSGPGIHSQDLQRIFERFYQIDKSRQGRNRGLGLGLAIAQEIVQAHGGSIKAYNKSELEPAGQGSVFVVRLPLPAQPTDNTRPRGKISGRSQRKVGKGQ
jgi:two-component system OmpR family sensor kinase